MQNNQWRITGDQLWRKSPIDLKGGSNVTSIVYSKVSIFATWSWFNAHKECPADYNWYEENWL